MRDVTYKFETDKVFPKYFCFDPTNVQVPNKHDSEHHFQNQSIASAMGDEHRAIDDLVAMGFDRKESENALKARFILYFSTI